MNTEQTMLHAHDTPLGDDAAFSQWREEIDTCVHLSDDEISLALIKDPILLYAAEHLTKLHGKPVERSDLECRIKASPRLQNVRSAAEWAHEQVMLAKCQEALAEKGRERAQRLERNQGPRCGARTRSGRPCERKVVLGKRRCPNHGGLSTGPRTPEGRARSLAALRRGARTSQS